MEKEEKGRAQPRVEEESAKTGAGREGEGRIRKRRRGGGFNRKRGGEELDDGGARYKLFYLNRGDAMPEGSNAQSEKVNHLQDL